MKEVLWKDIFKDESKIGSAEFRLLSNWSELTPKLKFFMPNIKVTLLFHAQGQAYNSELEILRQSQNSLTEIREVILGEERPFMFSRTVFSKNIDHIERANFSGLGEKRLGEILFAEDSIYRRKFIEYTRLNSEQGSWLYKKAKVQNIHCPREVWARRSLFVREESPVLLLTDIFYKIINL